MIPANHSQSRDHIAQEFFYHLHDTLVLLGADAKLAALLDNPDAIRAADVDHLRRYNGQLIDATKAKLVNINKLAVVVAS